MRNVFLGAITLHRKVGELIKVGDCWVHLLDSGRNSARIRVIATKSVKILRGELVPEESAALLEQVGGAA